MNKQSIRDLKRKKPKLRRTHAGRIRKEDIHGDPLGTKPEGVARLLFENFDGIAPWKPRNEKIVWGRKVARHLEADVYGGAELRANWFKVGHDCKLEQLFGSENKMRAVTGHNEHENFGRSQEGGTGLMVFDEATTLIQSMGVDDTKLGRWVWARFAGKDGHVTRVVVAYQPVRTGKKSLKSVYAQHR